MITYNLITLLFLLVKYLKNGDEILLFSVIKKIIYILVRGQIELLASKWSGA